MAPAARERGRAQVVRLSPIGYMYAMAPGTVVSGWDGTTLTISKATMGPVTASVTLTFNDVAQGQKVLKDMMANRHDATRTSSGLSPSP